VGIHKSVDQILRPSIMEVLSGMLVVAFGVLLIGLAVLITIKPQLAERFLRSFASSARAHYAEQALRLIAGGGVVIFAPSMWYPELFKLFGWLIVVTAVTLLFLPWRWHYELGKWAIPLVIRQMKLFALGAFALAYLSSMACLVSYFLEDGGPTAKATKRNAAKKR
jgi:hypothetical protein